MKAVQTDALVAAAPGIHARDAQKAAQAAVRAYNESAESYVFLATIHERLGPSADNDAAAIVAYRQAIARDAGHAIALNNLAYLLAKDPASTPALMLSGQIYDKLHKFAQARDAYEKLLAAFVGCHFVASQGEPRRVRFPAAMTESKSLERRKSHTFTL